MNPHWPIPNTALAAALAILGIPAVDGQEYTREIDTDTGDERCQWLFREVSLTDAARKTAELVAAWSGREAFERENPAHPLVSIRAAHDARTYLVSVIHGRNLPPVANFRGERYETPHLQEAAVLKAHGFPLLAFTGRAFSFPAVCRGRQAKSILAESIKPAGQKPAQWMLKFLVQYGHFLAVAKDTVPTHTTREGARVMMLPADMSTKTRDKFLDVF